MFHFLALRTEFSERKIRVHGWPYSDLSARGDRGCFHLQVNIECMTFISVRNWLMLSWFPGTKATLRSLPSPPQSTLLIHTASQNTVHEWSEAYTRNKCFGGCFSKIHRTFVPLIHTVIHSCNPGSLYPAETLQRVQITHCKKKFWEKLIAYFPFNIIRVLDMTSRKKI